MMRESYSSRGSRGAGDRRRGANRRPRGRSLIVRHHFRAFLGTQSGAPIRLFVIALVLGMLLPAVFTPMGVGTAYAYLSRELPPPAWVTARQTFQSTLIYDRNGKLLYEIFDPEGGRRTPVRLTDVPSHLINATIAVEDPSFYQNPGFDILAIARAGAQNFRSGGVVSGASTLTQQLARNVLFDLEERTEQSYTRKLKETIFAVWLTQTLSKDQILELYFNEVYYGHLSYGIVAAARVYFDKKVSDLTLAEAALLAGLPQAPSDYDPYIHLEAAKARQVHVLDRMVYHGLIEPEEADWAKVEPLSFSDPNIRMRAPHFVDYVREQIGHRYGPDALYRSGWKITTTLDLDLQEMAVQLARQRVAEIRQPMNAKNSAVVIIRPTTGEILTMAGSIDYWDESIDGRVNVAVARRMPGSTIKPFTYVTAFARGFVPNARVDDVKTCFETGYTLPLYCPSNFDLTFHGNIKLREALASSLNIPAVKLLTRVGVDDMIATAHRMGLTTIEDPSRFGLAVGLGVADVKLLDLAFAYSGIANGGTMIGAPVPLAERQPNMRELEPAAILRIEDPAGNEVYRYQPYALNVVSPQAAWLLLSVLGDDSARHFTFSQAGALVLDRPAAAKTGTTHFTQDTWTIGFTPDLTTGVWVGNSDAEPMRNIIGILSAGQIWHNVMMQAHRYYGLPPRDFVQPPGVRYTDVCGGKDWVIDGLTPICSVG
ncbi:MAG: transglycosylase domain-containing protein [Chloroflexi bacterium]|nr:transglycosylase domain-containing protein [Chloroflexota bacterium]